MTSEFSSIPAALGNAVAAAVARRCESPLSPGEGEHIARAFARESEADLREAFALGLVCFGGLTARGQLVLAPADDELIDASELLAAIDATAKGRRVAERNAAVLAALPDSDAPPPDPPAKRPVVLTRARHHARKQFARRH